MNGAGETAIAGKPGSYRFTGVPAVVFRAQKKHPEGCFFSNL
jgi:hypothetical protein